MKYVKFILLTGIILFFTGCGETPKQTDEDLHEQEEVSEELDENYLESLHSKTDAMVPDFFDTIMMEMLEDDAGITTTTMGTIYDEILSNTYIYWHFKSGSKKHQIAKARLKEIIDTNGSLLDYAIFYGTTKSHQTISNSKTDLDSNTRRQLHLRNKDGDKFNLVFKELDTTTAIPMHPLGIESAGTITPFFISHALSAHGAAHSGQGHIDAHYVAHNLHLDTTDTNYINFLNKVNSATFLESFQEESSGGLEDPMHYTGKLHCHEPGGRYPPGGGGCNPSVSASSSTMKYRQPYQDFNRSQANPHRKVPLIVVLPTREPGSEKPNPKKVKNARLMGVTWLTKQDIDFDGTTINMSWPVVPLYFGFDPTIEN